MPCLTPCPPPWVSLFCPLAPASLSITWTNSFPVCLADPNNTVSQQQFSETSLVLKQGAQPSCRNFFSVNTYELQVLFVFKQPSEHGPCGLPQLFTTSRPRASFEAWGQTAPPDFPFDWLVSGGMPSPDSRKLSFVDKARFHRALATYKPSSRCLTPALSPVAQEKGPWVKNC